jgi:glycerol-3-phosphate dehydrogenase
LNFGCAPFTMTEHDSFPLMKRDVEQLAGQRYDLLIVGAGIYGACVARDAAMRGLNVALLDKGDFGHATSANSLKIIHGGLRYLQEGNLRLARQMARERATWQRIAPHLVGPLPCLLPTGYSPLRRRSLLKAALALHRLITSFNGDSAGDKAPSGRVISRADLARLLPGAMLPQATGATLWYDALMHDSERLLLSVVLSAAAHGAALANYVEVTGILKRAGAVCGVEARDTLNGRTFEVQARLVVNCAGSWAATLPGLATARPHRRRFPYSVALNLVTRQWWPGCALALPGITRPHHRAQTSLPHTWFVVPWRQYSLVGTRHVVLEGPPDTFRCTEEHVAAFLADLNESYPAAQLGLADVYHVHCGFLPSNSPSTGGPVRLLRQGYVYDHAEEEGLDGLITVIGVKYTSARAVAEQAVDVALRKLGLAERPCRSHEEPLFGGATGHFPTFLRAAVNGSPAGTTSETIRRLAHRYGAYYLRILAYGRDEPELLDRVTDSAPVTKAEVVHTVRYEMAVTLADVILRRTGLGAAGMPDPACLRACAELMATELGWDQGQIDCQVEAVYDAYPFLRYGRPRPQGEPA